MSEEPKKVYRFHWPKRCQWIEEAPIQAVATWKEINGEKVQMGDRTGVLYRCALCGNLRESAV